MVPYLLPVTPHRAPSICRGRRGQFGPRPSPAKNAKGNRNERRSPTRYLADGARPATDDARRPCRARSFPHQSGRRDPGKMYRLRWRKSGRGATLRGRELRALAFPYGFRPLARDAGDVRRTARGGRRTACARPGSEGGMSNLWLNWRFVYWHLQIGSDRPRVRIRFNRWRWDHKDRSPLFEFH